MQIPESLLAAIYQHAREAFPAECCGWLAGPQGANEVLTIRQCNNRAPIERVDDSGRHRSSHDSFAIEGDQLLEFHRALQTDTPPQILYHSHPNGRAYFSEDDRRGALSPWGTEPSFPVQHLVIGITRDSIVEAAQYAWSPTQKAFQEVARLPGRRL